MPKMERAKATTGFFTKQRTRAAAFSLGCGLVVREANGTKPAGSCYIDASWILFVGLGSICRLCSLLENLVDCESGE